MVEPVDIDEIDFENEYDKVAIDPIDDVNLDE